MDDKLDESVVTPSQAGLLAAALLVGIGLIYVSTQLPAQGFWQILAEASGTALFLAAPLGLGLRRLLEAARQHDTAAEEAMRSFLRSVQDKLRAIQDGLGEAAEKTNKERIENEISLTYFGVKDLQQNVGYLRHELVDKNK